ncbi:MAG TPA: DNA double-strand break repair nuclease NurA [Anaerolineae bacterium]|nr:DNA double-strand break repair nuclease NurA [Anaerolineae bacterium]
MSQLTTDSLFAELPASLVDEVLSLTKEKVSQELLRSFEEIKENRDIWQDQLSQHGLIKHESMLPRVESPTCCGSDGSYAIERLLATDLLVAGAVAVEGLTPPSETRFWPEPRHVVYADTESHHADTGSILRGVMIGMELCLAQNAPHELIFLDGSLTTPTIFFNQALSKASEIPHLKISKRIKRDIIQFLESYLTVLTSTRSDRFWIALPKYTTRREIGEKLHWPETYDDRGMLSTLLQVGEYTKPLPLKKPKTDWHISIPSLEDTEKEKEIGNLIRKVTNGLNEIRVIYYRPDPYLPALRVEMNRATAETHARLSTVIKGIKEQCGAAAIMEPYPLYLADRMIKHLPKAMPAFRQIVSQTLSETYQGDINDIFTNLHSYRTESGR